MKHLYDSQSVFTTISENSMKQLLTITTKNSHFHCNNKIDDQIDKVSMRSSLAPLLTAIFLQDFKKKSALNLLL